MNCRLCGRELDMLGEPFSIDCGGDCNGCVMRIEAELGYQPGAEELDYQLEKETK